MHAALRECDHRPWPVPRAAWTWRQSWQDLLFVHWPISAAHLRPLVPAALALDEFEGVSWIGVVPFRMCGVMRRPWPDVPGLSAFPELNVRVYVTLDGKPGVWFLSLDASNPIAVWAARRFFHLPYYRARMSVSDENGTIQYSSHRPGAAFAATYRPVGETYRAQRGTLEHWLTERYCLYAQAPNGTLWRNEVHHVPWPLQPARVEIQENTMLNSHGLTVTGAPKLIHFARRVDVVVWNAERVA